MKFYRLIAAAFIISILCSAFIPKENAYASTYDRDYAEADAVLTYIMGNVFDKEVVTRAEFTGALISSMKLSGEAKKASFSDVNDKIQYYDEIYTAVKLGIVNDGEKFYPTENITYEQAIKMMVCTIGYENIAEYEGGYPLGYINTANRIGFTKGAYNAGENLGGHDAKILLYRLLCSTIRLSEIKNNSAYYDDTNVSYLESLYKLICEEGIVEANNYNPLSGGISDKNSYITINGENYEYDGDSASMLGKSVYLFHIKDEYKAEIVVSVENSELKIKKDNISEITSNEMIVLDENTSKTKKYDIKGARFIYNGKKISEFNLTDLTGDSTEFTLLDNNDDGIYEYVFIYDWKYLYIDMIDRTNGVISDINSDKESMLIPSKPNMNLHIYDENGNVIERDDLRKYDIVAVALTDDGDFATIKKCNNKVSGKITETDSDNNVYIDEKKYSITSYAKRNYSDIIAAGRESIFCIGVDDDIVVITNFSTQMEYGYMISALPWEAQSTQDIAIKIYTLNGKIKLFRVEKVKIDTTSGLKGSSIISNLSGGSPQLIKYKTNEHGELIAIDTAKIVNDFVKDENEKEGDSLKQFKFIKNGAEVNKFTYRSGGQSCMPYFNVSSSNIISVPDDSDIRSAEEEDFSVANKSILKSGSEYQFDIYDLEENGTPGMLVVKGQGLKSNTNYIIEKIDQGLMPDESIGKILSVYGNGEFTKVYLKEKEELNLNDTLNEGDIVEMTLQNDNSVKYIDIVFKGTELEASTSTSSGIKYEGLGNISYWMGAVYYTDGTYAYVSKTKNGSVYDYSMSNLINLKINVTNIPLINKDRTEIKLIKSSELKDYKSFGNENYYIVARLNSQLPMEVYAYEIQ